MKLIKKILSNVWGVITHPLNEYKRKKELNKRIAELRKRDPFIYK